MAKLQHIIFNVGQPPEDKILENTQPGLILAGSIAAAFGLPGTVDYIKPLVVSQGRRKRSLIFQIASKAAVAATRSLTSLHRPSSSISSTGHHNNPRHSLGSDHFDSLHSRTYSGSGQFLSEQSPPQSPDLSIPNYLNYRHGEQVYSLPNLHSTNYHSSMARSTSNGSISSMGTGFLSLPPSLHSQHKHIDILKSNYFYCETQFMDALHKISNKLLQVPKQARLSALRVEIAMLNKDLPAEVDIPLLLPSTLFPSRAASIRSFSSNTSTFGHKANDLPPKQNRVVRIVPSEAVLLNSAERVPYLLLIEYIRNDVDFDPSSERNRPIAACELNRKHIFDTISAPMHDHYSVSAPASARNSEDSHYDSHHHGSHRGRQLSLSDSPGAYFHNDSHTAFDFIPENDILPREESDMGDVSAIDLFEDKKSMMANHSLSASLSSLASLNSNSHLSNSLGTSGSHTAMSSLNISNSVHNSASPRASDLSFSTVYFTPVQPADDTDKIDDLATHMRTAAIMINQLENSKLSKSEIERIKQKIINSMQTMEENTIYQNSIGTGAHADDEAGIRKLENDLLITGLDEGADMISGKSKGSLGSHTFKGVAPTPIAVANAAATAASKGTLNLGEDWKVKKERIRRSSPYGHLPNWDLFSCIAKTGSDLRQEAFACQLIQAMQMCWEKNNTGLWVKKMRILITHNCAGLVETITNALSIHSIKKAMSTVEDYRLMHTDTHNTSTNTTTNNSPKKIIPSLKSYFEMTFGSSGPKLDHAIDCFVCSLASYSLICYLLQIKDRHNGNILLDNEGHIMHIDFGFLLSNSPGRVGFETSPFKLTYEYIELMGGADSPAFCKFKDLMKKGFRDIRKEAENIIILVEMMQRDSGLPCFSSGAATAQQLRQRFQLQMSDNEVDQFVETQLIQKSYGSLSSRLYDQYQLLTQGIYS